MEVSVIIPVFNAKKYLHRCIESVLNQSFADYEILLIDDGSTDGSDLICDEYARQNDRITVIHQPNSGVSFSCNLGIEKARGRYLMFCDSDDFVEHDWIKALYQNAKDNPEAFVFSAYYKDDNNESKTVCINHALHNKRYPIEEYYCLYKNRLSSYRWNRIYLRKKIFGIIRFDERVRVGEDVLFNIEYMKKCSEFLYVDKPLYHWTDCNPQSLSRAYYARYYDDIKPLYFPRISVIAEKDLQSFYDEYYYRFYSCIDIVNDKRNTMSAKEKKAYIRYILHDEEFCHAWMHSERSLFRFVLRIKNYNLIQLFKILVSFCRRIFFY